MLNKLSTRQRPTLSANQTLTSTLTSQRLPLFAKQSQKQKPPQRVLLKICAVGHVSSIYREVDARALGKNSHKSVP